MIVGVAWLGCRFPSTLLVVPYSLGCHSVRLVVSLICWGIFVGVFFGACRGFNWGSGVSALGSGYMALFALYGACRWLCGRAIIKGVVMPFIGLYLPCLVCHPRCCDYAINWAVWWLSCGMVGGCLLGSINAIVGG